jgi:uncharacterized membrane protein
VSTAKSDRAAATGAVLEWDWLRVLSIVIAIVGLFVAGYMTWAEATGNETVCADTGAIDCAVVQESAYASTLGIPVALMGMLGYIAILAVLVLEDQIEIVATYGRTWIVAMALFGVMFQLYLTYVEGAVLEKWCQWCIMSFIAITALFALGVFRLNTFMKPLRD